MVYQLMSLGHALVFPAGFSTLFGDKLCTEEMKAANPVQCIDGNSTEDGYWVEGSYESYKSTGSARLAFRD